jgi:hypothetical protein
MIAHENDCSRAMQTTFLEMLPAIRNQANVAFRDLPPQRQEDLIAEVTANAFVAYTRLVERGLADIAYPTPLALFAIKQVRSGRRVGVTLNVRDVGSRYCQKVKGVTVESLDRFDKEESEWQEIVVGDKKSGPAEVAAIRLDFTAWLQTLPRRSREIAKTLAVGETTSNVARKYRVSPGRVSQVRRELKQSWEAFRGEPALA